MLCKVVVGTAFGVMAVDVMVGVVIGVGAMVGGCDGVGCECDDGGCGGGGWVPCPFDAVSRSFQE